jgi:two-component system LytT family response regulator
MKTVIVEDEMIPALDLERQLKEFPDIEIMGIAHTIDQARKLIALHRPELLMMDIQMDADQTTTFDLLQELKDKQQLKFELIFMSAHQSSSYLLRAVRLACLDYLVKPINHDELSAALDKARKSKEGFEMLENQVQLAINFKDNVKSATSTIIVPSHHKTLEQLDLNKILYIETSGNSKMTVIHFADDQKPMISTRSIGFFRDLLAPDLGFFMIHESRIIHLKHMVSFDLNDRIVYLRSNKEQIRLDASRRHGKMLKDYLSSKEGDRKQEETISLSRRIWRALRG